MRMADISVQLYSLCLYHMQHAAKICSRYFIGLLCRGIFPLTLIFGVVYLVIRELATWFIDFSVVAPSDDVIGIVLSLESDKSHLSGSRVSIFIVSSVWDFTWHQLSFDVCIINLLLL